MGPFKLLALPLHSRQRGGGGMSCCTRMQGRAFHLVFLSETLWPFRSQPSSIPLPPLQLVEVCRVLQGLKAAGACPPLTPPLCGILALPCYHHFTFNRLSSPFHSIAASSDGSGGVPRPARLQRRAHLLGCPGGARQAVPCHAGERPLSGRLKQTAVTCNSTLSLTA